MNKVNYLHNFFKRILLERVGEEPSRMRLGMYDRPGPGPDSGYPETIVGSDETTLGEEVPVEPSEMMANQLAQDTPPIEDPDYTPGSSVELGRAANLVAKMVPDDQIELYYKGIHDLLDQTVQKSNEQETEDPAEEDESPVPIDKAEEAEPEEDKKNVKEGSFRRAIRNILESGPMYGYDSEDEDLGDRPEIDWMGDEGDDMPPMSSSSQEDQPGDGASLETMASEFGYSSPSGARQDIGRITKKAEFLVDNMSDAEMSALKNQAAQEFVTGLADGGYIDETDLKELLDNPSETMSLDSFRYFFMAAFVMPAYQELVRTSRKDVQAEIEKIGVPVKAQQSVLNQALGDVPKNLSKLSSKIESAAQAEGMSPEESQKIVKKLQSSFDSLTKKANVEGDLGKLAGQKWNSANDSKKQKLLRQSLQQTQEFQGM
jgi:hypothetical protein